LHCYVLLSIRIFSEATLIHYTPLHHKLNTTYALYTYTHFTGTLGGGANNKKLSRAFGNAWRGAAAYHYYMLSLKQFYDGKWCIVCVYVCVYILHFSLCNFV